MRLFLDRLYAGSLFASAASFAAIAGLVLIQVLGRLIDRAARLVGAPPPGLTVPSLAEIGGFLFVAGVTLGLAGTFVRGGHVRVSLLTRALPPGAGRGLSALVAAAALGLSAFGTWSSWLQTVDSWVFDSVSFGMIRVPLWLPQGVMTLGLALLTVALLDALIQLLRGATPAYEIGEAEAGGEG
ncbi:TRAP transporter small permease [Pseudoroseicyclus aestuarii]|uniref:TRAP transporter small permease protein n=1 Tax=Pseudoroseicyclus aestuarii TaxID=1795041 RepID=A0A318SM95_9RHOB|nr:TRAP transporter small permease [Pseudoroseicyclus aestuarii]PYE81160.1 TRAP-type C4-dicarboxylate transport system permease small subunit [Pseudoroseicyclus aestuarii]